MVSQLRSPRPCHNALAKKAREQQPGPGQRRGLSPCLSLWPMVQARSEILSLPHLDINNDGDSTMVVVSPKLCLYAELSGYSLLQFRREGDGDANKENTC